MWFPAAGLAVLLIAADAGQIGHFIGNVINVSLALPWLLWPIFGIVCGAVAILLVVRLTNHRRRALVNPPAAPPDSPADSN
jgi:hypothetical protein